MAVTSPPARFLARTALGALMALGAGSGAALADFPGERWGIDLVRVSGAPDPGVANRISLGLRQANETYFFGARRARMEAAVRPDGNVDVRILDAASGSVMAERRGLPVGGGDVSDSVAAAALAWYDDLACAEGCQVAASGSTPTAVPAPAGAPTEVVETAEAPASAAPKTAAPEAPAPDQRIAVTPDRPERLALAVPEAPTPEVAPAAVTPSTAGIAPRAPAAEPATGTQAGLAALRPGDHGPEGPVAGIDAARLLSEANGGRAANLTRPALDGQAAPDISPGSSGPWVGLPPTEPPTGAAPVALGPQDQVAALATASRDAATLSPGPEAAAPEVVPSLAEPASAGGAPTLTETPRVAVGLPAAQTGSTGPRVAAAPVEPAAGARVPGPAEGEIAAATPRAAAGDSAPRVVPGIDEPLTAQPRPGQPSGRTGTDSAVAAVGPEAAVQEIAPGLSLPRAGTAAAARPAAADTGGAPVAGAAERAPAPATSLALGEPATGQPVSVPRLAETSGTPALARRSEGRLPATPPVQALAPASPDTAVRPVAPELGTATAAGSDLELPVTAPVISDQDVARIDPEGPVALTLQDTASAIQPQAAPRVAAPADRAPAQPSPATDLARGGNVDGDGDGDGQTLALADPAVTDAPVPSASPRAPDPQPARPATPQTTTSATGLGIDTRPAPQNEPTVESRVAAVDPQAAGPTLANAQWVGFTPAVFTVGDDRPGAWISGPFDREQRVGWITDTATGATTRVQFIWREAGGGERTAALSRAAAAALGLGQGDVANVAVYLPR